MTTREAHPYVWQMLNVMFYLFYTIFIFQHESLNLLFHLYSFYTPTVFWSLHEVKNFTIFSSEY